jgi:uncharacterized membrane protein
MCCHLLLLPLTLVVTACQDPAAPPPRRLLGEPLDARGAALKVTWEVIPLTANAYAYARSYSINDSNVVVGTANAGANGAANVAWRWRDSTFEVLPLPAGANARGINRRGEIVGSVGQFDTDDGCSSRPYHLSPDGVFTWLPVDSANGYVGGAANDVDDGGRIVGTSVGVCAPIPTQWTPTSPHLGIGWRRQMLDTARGIPRSINNQRFVAGFSSGHQQARYWKYPGISTQLPNPSPNWWTWAYGINNLGYIVGGNELWGAWYWLHPFLSGPLGFDGNAYAISDKQRIAGAEIVSGTPWNPLAWSPVTMLLYGGSWTTLSLPVGATEGSAMAVNTCGVIAGHVTYPRPNAREVPVIWRRLVGGIPTCD